MTNYKNEFKGGWIGVDFDGTLASYNGWKGPNKLGEPLMPMVNRVKQWIEEGREVRIMTARVSPLIPDWADNVVDLSRKNIEEWCEKHIGQKLRVTHEKDYNMIELWDDRAIQVEFNTGKPMHVKE
jgi:hypothetical protein